MFLIPFVVFTALGLVIGIVTLLAERDESPKDTTTEQGELKP